MAQEAPELTLPDLNVRILTRLAVLDIDGLLGVDFFRRFDRVFPHRHGALGLEYPPASGCLGGRASEPPSSRARGCHCRTSE